MAYSTVLVLPETGLVKADLDLRVYDGAGDAVSIASVTVTEGTDRHYTIGALPDGSTADPHTLTYRVTGQVGAIRWPTLVSPPDVVIVALGVTGESGTLDATLYRDAVEYVGASLTITEPASGDYKIAGIPDLSGSWKLVIQSSLGFVEVDYPGQSGTGVLVTVTDLKAWLGESWTDASEDLLEAAEQRAVYWLERETHRRLRTGLISPVLRGPGGGGVMLPSPITATTAAGLPAITSVEIRGAPGSAWEELDLDDVEIVEIPDVTTHELHWTAGTWPLGPLTVRPTYLTGYQATGSPSTPPDLALAVCEVVAQHFFGSRQATKRESTSFDARFRSLVNPTIRRYTNPYKFQRLIEALAV